MPLFVGAPSTVRRGFLDTPLELSDSVRCYGAPKSVGMEIGNDEQTCVQLSEFVVKSNLCKATTSSWVNAKT